MGIHQMNAPLPPPLDDSQMNSRAESSRRRNVRLSSIAAAALAAFSVGLWSGCATAGSERAAETPSEDRLPFLYPERDSGTPTRSAQSEIERKNHERDRKG
jgi:hypothetical protein